jgi:hypothetical protein
MSDVPRSAAMAGVYAAAKLLLMKLSSDAKTQSKNPKSISLALLRGVLGGLGFVSGGASALHVALVLSSRVARLGQAAWCFGSALVYWVVLHIVGRRLFPGSRYSVVRAQQRKLMSKAEQWKKLDEQRQAKEQAEQAAAAAAAAAVPEPEPEPEKVAPQPEPEPEPIVLSAYTVGCAPLRPARCLCFSPLEHD